MAYTQQTPIGTPDVNLITKTLAGLQPDSALQQYAMLHKNNPYILSLAKSESDRRKSLRTATQGNPGQQPTVVDQNIAGMAQQQLPENQGIAQIPTPNMQRMADGGIAGYEDDEEGMATGGMGGMFNFAQQSEPVVRMSGGGAVPRYQGMPPAMGGDGSVVKSSIQQIEDSNIAALSPLAQQFKTAEQQFIAAARSGDQAAIAQYMQVKENLRKQLEQAVSTKFGNAAPKVMSQLLSSDKPVVATPGNVVNPDEAVIAAEKAGRFKPAADKTPPSATEGVKDLLPGTAKLNTDYKPVTAPTTDAATTLGNKFTNLDARTSTINSQVAQKRSDITNAAKNRIAALEAFNKKQGPAYEGYEKLLKKEELQDATDKDKAGLMSLMKGFLAMAAGESPNAATNIAKGAMVGLGDYGDALKDFKKSAKERNKEMQNIENARRAESRGNFDKAEMYEYQADQNRIAATDAGIAAISKVTDTSAAVSAQLYSDSVKIASDQNIAAMREAGANKRAVYEQSGANARAQTPDKLVFDALVRQNNGDTVKAAEALQKMKAEKFNVYEAYSKYLAAFANKEGVSPPDPFDVFAKRFIPTVTPDKNTPIRTQPGG
jgi:hypothetical protein